MTINRLMRAGRRCALIVLALAGSLPARAAPAHEPEIFYHVFVRSFRDADGDRIGDLDGVTRGLDYIKALGATTVLLTPVQPSPFYHNYFATDFNGVAPEYGGMPAWTRLLRAVCMSIWTWNSSMWRVLIHG